MGRKIGKWKIDQIKIIEALKLELKSNLKLNPYY